MVWCAFSFCWLHSREAEAAAERAQDRAQPAVVASPTPNSTKAVVPAQSAGLVGTVDHALVLLARVVTSVPATIIPSPA